MTQQIVATYHANYNGWDISIDGQYGEHDEDLTGEMVDVTVDFCDDDGDYFYSQLQANHRQEIVNIINAKYPNAEIDFNFDTFST